MGIPIGTFVVATVRRQAEFKCLACGHQATAEVTSTGMGAQSLLQDPGLDEDRANEDALKDITRTIERARCPKCGQRSSEAVMRYFSPYLFGSAGFILLGPVLGFGPDLLEMRLTMIQQVFIVWVPLMVYFITLGSLFTVALFRFRSTERRVKWLS